MFSLTILNLLYESFNVIESGERVFLYIAFVRLKKQSFVYIFLVSYTHFVGDLFHFTKLSLTLNYKYMVWM